MCLYLSSLSHTQSQEYCFHFIASLVFVFELPNEALTKNDLDMTFCPYRDRISSMLELDEKKPSRRNINQKSVELIQILGLHLRIHFGKMLFRRGFLTAEMMVSKNLPWPPFS